MSPRSAVPTASAVSESVTLPLHGYGLFFFLAWWPVCSIGSQLLGIDIVAATWSSVTFVLLTIALFGCLFGARWMLRGGAIRIDPTDQTLTWLPPFSRVGQASTWRYAEVAEVAPTTSWQPAGVRIRVAGRNFTARTTREYARELAAALD